MSAVRVRLPPPQKNMFFVLLKQKVYFKSGLVSSFKKSRNFQKVIFE
jgi:hypothetical protein